MPKAPKKKKKKSIDPTTLTLTQTSIPLPEFELQNVVATFNLGVDYIDLRAIALEKPFVEYNPHKFAAASLRIRSPRTTALAFASGNMVLYRSQKQKSNPDLQGGNMSALCRNMAYLCSFRDFKIQNIVASAEIPHALKLVELSKAYGPYVSL